MAWFLSLVRTLSVISVILAAVWLLIPNGSLAKSFRFAISLFALSAIVSAVVAPATNGRSSVIAAVEQKADYSVTANQLTAVNTEYAIGKLLENENIFYKKLALITDNSADDGIHITKVMVELQSESDFTRAAALVMQETGLELVGG